MSWKYTTIERKDGRIYGEMEDSDTISIVNNGWIESSTTEEPEWKNVSEQIIERVFDSDKEIEGESRVSIDLQNAENAISDSDYINHEDDNQETLMARLLLEYLVSKDVYTIDNDNLVILENPTIDTGTTRENYRNWQIFMQTAAENRKSLITEIKSVKEDLIDSIEDMDISTDIVAKYQNHLGDLVQISNENLSRDAVAEEDQVEFDRKKSVVETLYPAIKDRKDTVDVEAIVGNIIGDLEAERDVLIDRARTYGLENIEEAAKQVRERNTTVEPDEIDPMMDGSDIQNAEGEELAHKLFEAAPNMSLDDIGSGTTTTEETTSDQTNTGTPSNDDSLDSDDLDGMVNDSFDDTG